MTVKNKASADGILRPPRVALSSFSTHMSIPCGMLGSMRFALKAGSLVVASVTRSQLIYTYHIDRYGSSNSSCGCRSQGPQRERERDRQTDRQTDRDIKTEKVRESEKESECESERGERPREEKRERR